MNRRELLTGFGKLAAAGVASQILRPVQALAADVKRVNIQNIEVFAVQVPRSAGAPPPAAPTNFNPDPYRVVCTRVTTDSGVRGYSFAGGSTADVEQARTVLLGEDLFA